LAPLQCRPCFYACCGCAPGRCSLGHRLWPELWSGHMGSNPSIERTPSSVLCTLPVAAHVKR
jgi:hypothetical protein